MAFAFRRNVAHPVLLACVDVALPVVLLLMVVGNADELRMFADVMTLVFLALATAIDSGSGARFSNAGAPRATE
jgi:hypothetical protein